MKRVLPYLADESPLETPTVGSVVTYNGTQYLVSEMGCCGVQFDYALIGHESLHSEGMGTAWHQASSFTQVLPPTDESLHMLMEAINLQSEDEDLI